MSVNDGGSSGPGVRPGRAPAPGAGATHEDDTGEADRAAPAPVDDALAATAPLPVATGGDEGAAGTPAEADVAPDPLAAERTRAAEYLALAQRTQADFENYRKRIAREAALAETRGAGRVARELLPALDNLALALDAADGEGEGDGHLAQGIRLVQSELHAALRRVGIEPFSPQGERFDPVLHEAMASQPADGVEPGTVLEVYQRGYRHHDTVLRPARVVVSAAAG